MKFVPGLKKITPSNHRTSQRLMRYFRPLTLLMRWLTPMAKRVTHICPKSFVKDFFGKPTPKICFGHRLTQASLKPRRARTHMSP
jgi:hypothetical protein